MATRIGDDLLERESELARAGDLVAEVRAGQGRLVVMEGPAGIGKTVLLEQVSRVAGEHGFHVLRARGTEVEREFPHGVVRQLFEADLRARSPDERSALLSGAAELAAPIVAPGDTPADPQAGDAFAVTHGLYWLAANVAEDRPLVIAVDDAQWSDVVSLRFLVHLALRLEGTTILLAVSVRTDELDEPELLVTQLRSRADAEVLRPAPLSEDGIATVLAATLGEQPDRDFAAACLRATGGTPFLVGELARELAAKQVRPTHDAVAEVVDVVPQAVTRAIVLRLARAPEPAAELARAVAVLGADAQLNRAARLAEIAEVQAVEAADVLAAMGIFRSGLPLEFTHPLVRGAIYDDFPKAARASAHARAAALLVDDCADQDAIAAQLLLSPPAARPETVEHLRRGAAEAMRRGAPESAGAYLRRALREGGLDPQDRARLLFALGKAERLDRPHDAIEHFREAHGLADDPVEAARIAYELVDTLVYVQPSWDEQARLVEESVAAVQDRDEELAVRFEALRAASEFYDARQLGGLLERLPRLTGFAGGESAARRSVALQVANLNAWLGGPKEEIHRLLDLGLHGGRSPAEESPESWLVPCAVQSYTLIEDHDRALQVADEALEIAQARGSIMGVVIACSTRGLVHGRRGDLVSAEADARTVFKLTDQVLSDSHGRVPMAEIAAIFHALDPLVERKELEDEARRVQAVDFSAVGPDSLWWALGLEPRGRVRLALGDVDGGIHDLNLVEQTLYAHNNPNGWGWRPALALAVAGRDRDRAFELLDVYLSRAREIGLPRAIGIGLRTLGLVERGEEGLAHLEEAVQVLNGSPAPLEHARALVELGAARRRAGQRAAAREPLREGLNLAHRCGATRLEQRAHEELKATGARPRRAMLTGRDALTATEQRIAAMAADGMSNPEIAQALFVTRKTVENHLGRIYPKLGINSRGELPDALDRTPG